MNFVRYLLERTRDPEKLFILGDHGTLSYAEFLQKVEDVTSVLLYSIWDHEKNSFDGR